MKAVVYEQYGPPEVLHLTEMDTPNPKDDEVRIKVHASAVTAGDVNMRGFTFVPPGFGPLPRLMFGLFKPRKPVLGVVVAGEVVEVGREATAFHVGDAVFSIDASALGGYAEYACRRAKGSLATKPTNLSFAEAAALPFGAGTALYFLRDKANVQPGQSVLVNGASGGTGVYAVQLAKHFGAEVTAVCSTRNLDLVASLGADHVIDYTQQDYTESGDTYDVIFDAVSGHASFARAKRVLSPEGIYLAVAGGPREMLQAAGIGVSGKQKVVAGAVDESAESLTVLKQLAEAGHIRAVIDRTFPLDEIVEAHRYVDTGRKRGSVIVEVSIS